MRLTHDEHERQYWLDKAMAVGHPEAFLSAEDAMNKDLPGARELMVKAAEKGSRSAMAFLVSEYRSGGFLFDKDTSLATHWLLVLSNTSQAETDPQYLTESFVKQLVEEPNENGNTAESGVPLNLFRLANSFLRHQAKDDILQKRALEYLEKAAAAGYGAAALQFGQIIMKK